MTSEEFSDGLDQRKERVAMAASQCVRHLKREMIGIIGETSNDRLLTALGQTRFNPVLQRELVEAVQDYHDFTVGGGKYARRPTPLELE